MKKLTPMILLAAMILALTGCSGSPEYFTVSFDTNGAVKGVASQLIKNGYSAVEPKDPVKENARFKEWTLNGQLYDFSSPVTSDIKLVASYTDAVTCKITFDSDDGSEVQNSIQYVEKGGYATEPASPATLPSSAWGFKEWAHVKDDGTTESFDFRNTSVESDMEFKAVYWKKYTVTYKRSDGTDYKTEYVKEGTAAPQLEGPLKEGAWSFNCWVKDGATEAYNFETQVNENLILNATYVEGYRIQFYSDGGDYTPSEQFVAENGLVTEPKSPDKASTRGFLWWATEDGKSYDFSTHVKSSFTLTAVYWPANIITGGDSTRYDDDANAVKNEVGCMHYIMKKLVQNDKLMKNGTDFTEVFGTTYGTDNHTSGDALLLEILTNAMMTPEKVPLSGDSYAYISGDIGDVIASYNLDEAGCSIGTNTTEVTTNDINTKYTVNITGLKIKVKYNFNYVEYSEEADISLSGTFIKNSDERYEMRIQMKVNETEYPVLHAIATKSGDDGDDNVVFFNYKGLSSYVPGKDLW